MNYLNTPLKGQRLSELDFFANTTICCLQESHFKYNGTDWLKLKRWRKICHYTNQKNAEVAILISN